MISTFIHPRCNHRASRIAVKYAELEEVERTETTATLRGTGYQQNLYYVKYWSFTKSESIDAEENGTSVPLRSDNSVA